jgi:hypothetical protein
MKTISNKRCRETRNTHLMFNNIFFFKNRPCFEITWKYFIAGQATNDNVAHAGYLRLQTHTLGMDYLVFMQSNSGCTNAPQCYVKRTLFVLFSNLRSRFLHLLFVLLAVAAFVCLLFSYHYGSGKVLTPVGVFINLLRLIHTYHAVPMPRPYRSPAMPCR